MKFAILKNEFDDNHEYWERSCKTFNQEYQIIDILDADWLNYLTESNFDGYLTCPPGRESLFKQMYDERMYILDKVLGKFLYPNYDEISLHENKKYLSYWLNANKLPHAWTKVFYSYGDALSFIKSCDLPIVGKFNIGASGKGVIVFYDRKVLINYANQAFKSGIRQEWGPNLQMGSYKTRIINIIKNPSLIKKKLRIYHKTYSEVQKGFLILQEYIPHDFEWRVVRIGDSYFGHQKIKHGDKASGTKGIDYTAPPEDLLDFIKIVCEKYGFNSMAVDLFEDKHRGYLINEMQCIFGHVQAFICEKDKEPGRFISKDKNWLFEPGMFNGNLSYDLRLENVLSLLNPC